MIHREKGGSRWSLQEEKRKEKKLIMRRNKSMRLYTLRDKSHTKRKGYFAATSEEKG